MSARPSDPSYAAYHTDECEATKAREDGMQNWPTACNCKGRTLPSNPCNVGWLIERVGHPGLYFSPGWRKDSKWEWITTDPNEAVRFVRQEDANRAKSMFHAINSTFFQGTDWKATEHVWIDRAAPETFVQSQATSDVLSERRRQVTAEGWTPEHDDEHSDGALARAAACYAVGIKHLEMPVANSKYSTCVWPFDDEWWKPKDVRRNLVRAAALIVAEIERMDRAAGNIPTSKNEPFVHPYANHPHQNCACGAKVPTDVYVLHTCGDRLSPKATPEKANDPLAQLEDDATFGEIVEEIHAGKMAVKEREGKL